MAGVGLLPGLYAAPGKLLPCLLFTGMLACLAAVIHIDRVEDRRCRADGLAARARAASQATGPSAEPPSNAEPADNASGWMAGSDAHNPEPTATTSLRETITHCPTCNGSVAGITEPSPPGKVLPGAGQSGG